MSETGAKPPKHLSPDAKRLWKELVEQFSIDNSAAFLLLQMAMEAYDEMKAAQVILKRDGPVIKNSRGAMTQHPATLCVRDARNLLLRSLKQLNLDLAPDDLGGGL
jgi:P27 family predicted phage terminase small subunit